MTETITYLLDKRLALHQPENGFRSGTDTVLVAAACPAQSGERVLDLGCGIGGAGLCVAMRVPGIHLTGVEIQADQVLLAEKNAALNKLPNCSFISSDVRDFNRAKDGKNILFDHVICNPPYNEAGAHTRSPSDAKALAMGHDETTLKDWVDAAARSLKSQGSFAMIHQAGAVDKILSAMEGRFGALEIIPFWPHAGEPAKRLIVRGYRDRKSPTVIYPGLVMHNADGSYTSEAEAVLRGMGAV